MLLGALKKPLPELITDPITDPEFSETSSFASSREVCSPSGAKAVLEGGCQYHLLLAMPSPQFLLWKMLLYQLGWWQGCLFLRSNQANEAEVELGGWVVDFSRIGIIIKMTALFSNGW
eukprot:10363440-Ditylum_brightwellii.AAC.1